MKNILKYLIILFFTIFIFSLNTIVNAQKVQDVFSDIAPNYKYLKELQTLYDRGMILPDSNGKFNPESLLNRDEFVGISMHTICKECISPNTPDDLVKKYTNTKPFFDVPANNNYFYCIADAKDSDFVRGYNNSYVCENGTTKSGEAPFCINNKITLEEAVAVLLRNSGIFSIQDNQNVLNQISAGLITEKISNDVPAKDVNGYTSTFYGYLRKGLEYTLVEYDVYGNKTEYKLITKDSSGNINPKKNITKEEFLRLAYITTKANSCSLKDYSKDNNKEINTYNLETQIQAFENTCEGTSLNISKANSQTLTYAFKSDNGSNNKVLKYSWEFTNKETGKKITSNKSCVSNFKFPEGGNWEINLNVVDDKGNTGNSTSTIYVYDDKTNFSKDLDVSFVASPSSGPGPLTTTFTPTVTGGDGSYTYNWNFCDLGSSQVKDPNYTFTKVGTCTTTLTVTDGSGNKSSYSQDIIVNSGNNSSGSNNGGNDDGGNNSSGSNNGGNGDGISVGINPSISVGNGPLDVIFTPIVKGGDGKYTYSWDFCNTGKSIIEKPNHTFENIGTCKTTLTVIDGSGNKTTTSVNIIVEDSNLNAIINGNPISGTGPLKSQFTSQVNGGDGKYTYSWDFGDGNKSSEKNPSNTFLKEGTYKVILTVKDGSGKEVISSLVVKVNSGIACGVNCSCPAGYICSSQDLNACTTNSYCLKDTDGDSVVDEIDKCPTIPGTKANLGCPVISTPCSNGQCKSGYFCSTAGYCEPAKEDTSLCVIPSSSSSVYGNLICNSCPCNNELRFISDIRKCDVLFPAIVSPDGKEIYSRGSEYQVPYEK